MNVGTRVLENGVWTHRIVGLHTILQHRQDQIEEDPSMMELPNMSPELGVMTSTLVNSPAANFILPIRIRDKDKNDVVFVNVRLPPNVMIPMGVPVQRLDSLSRIYDVAGADSPR